MRDINTEITEIQEASRGEDVRQSIVDALNELNAGTVPAASTSDAGKILYVNSIGQWVAGNEQYVPTPTGTINIDSNGTYDVTNKASAEVSVSGGTLIQKTITDNGTYDAEDDNADGYSSVSVNVRAGEFVRCAPIMYYGRAVMNAAQTIGGTITDMAGLTAILIVCHRDDITVSGWEQLVNDKNPMTSATGNIRQEVSIYKKVLQSNSEQFTVNQASSARISGAVFVFSKNISIVRTDIKEMDSTYSTYRYIFSLSQNNDLQLVVISNVYAGDAVTELKPEVLYTHDISDYIDGVRPTTWRFLPFVNTSPKNTEFKMNTSYTSDAGSVNRAFVYKITAV